MLHVKTREKSRFFRDYACASTSEGAIPDTFGFCLRLTQVDMERKTGEIGHSDETHRRFTRLTTIIIARYDTFNRRFRVRCSSDETRVYYNDVTIHYCMRKTSLPTHT